MLNRKDIAIHAKLNIKFLLFFIFIIVISDSYAGRKWEGKIPAVAKDGERWVSLIGELKKRKMQYGVISASKRVLMFFEDLKLKETAYAHIISMIDLGYPFSTQKVFETGDISPTKGYNLINSYNFYKATVNLDKGMKRWADHFFKKVDVENFAKYQFYLATQAYKVKNFDEAIKILKEILKKDFEKDQLSFVRKVARTLARIYFEKEEFKAAEDIYDNFLLKVNSIVVTDWLEAAWCKYYLKKYDQAIGYLYNLESQISKYPIILEKYVLRAAIYMDMCAIDHVGSLVKSFNRRFGREINGIIIGMSLNKFRNLKEIYNLESTYYFQTTQTLFSLYREARMIKDFPAEFRDLVKYLYKSEIKALKQASKFYEEEAIQRSAKQLVMLSEALKFLKFGTEREKFNPAVAFQNEEELEMEKVFDDLDEEGFRLRWRQSGDFWRDERNKYLGVITNKCAN